MKINLTKLLNIPNRVLRKTNNKQTTDAHFLEPKNSTISINDSPYSFELETLDYLKEEGKGGIKV